MKIIFVLLILRFCFFSFSDDSDNPFRFNTSKQAKALGYNGTETEILTEDDYILNIVHIFPNSSSKLYIHIILVHGLFGSSDDFVSNYKLSPAFILVDRGFDVWMLNNRGSKYSSKHKSPNITKKEYWQFTYEEKGLFDIKAIVLYVKQVTRSIKIHVIGYSEGATQLISSMILNSNFYDENVLSVSTWGLITRIDHHQSLMIELLSYIYIFDYFYWNDYYNPFAYRDYYYYLTNLINKGKVKSIFNFLIEYNWNLNLKSINMQGFIYYLYHFPSGESVHTLHHIMLGIWNKSFVRYNFLTKEASEAYDFSQLSNIPLLIIQGEEDLINNLQDTFWFHLQCMKANKTNVLFKVFEDIGHLSYIIPNPDYLEFINETIKFILSKNSK